MKAMLGGLLVAIGCVAAWGQTAAPKTEFEVASIRPSAPMQVSTANSVSIGVHIDGAQFRCSQLSLRDYIRIGFEIKDFQVVGPEWIATERFDINAKFPDGAKITRDLVNGSIRTLLLERFQLQTHQDKKEFPVYVLTVGKTLKLQESPLDPETTGRAPVDVKAQGSAAGVSVSMGRGASYAMDGDKLIGRKMSMLQVAEQLGRGLDRPVLDQTKLTGTYDFSFEVTPDDFRAMMIRSGLSAGVVLPPQAITYMEQQTLESLFAALEKVGLKLERQKAPLDVLVVDKVLKVPLEN